MFLDSISVTVGQLIVFHYIADSQTGTIGVCVLVLLHDVLKRFWEFMFVVLRR